MKLRPIIYIFLLALVGCTAPPGAEDPSASNPPSDVSLVAGRRLYVNKCARCHKLYDPANYSETEWREWIDKMSRKAKLKSEQEELLSRYLDTLRTPK
jgi:hypothetical protein